MALDRDLKGGFDLAFKGSLLLLASPKSPTLHVMNTNISVKLIHDLYFLFSQTLSVICLYVTFK